MIGFLIFVLYVWVEMLIVTMFWVHKKKVVLGRHNPFTHPIAIAFQAVVWYVIITMW